jgi:hypothetical protein
MPRPRHASALLLTLLAASACGRLQVVDVPEPEDSDAASAPAPRARAVSESTGAAWASQLALDACRAEIARRWRVPERDVRTSSRAHDSSDRTDLVNWDVGTSAGGFCRVDARGTVLNVVTERSPAPPPDVAAQPTPAPVPPAPRPVPAEPADPDAEPEPAQVARTQLEACRNTVVRELSARPDDVGLSAGTPDERGTVLIDWSLGTGGNGTCLVDSSNTVVQFRR